jgi:outer membrane protein assembly factor BamB
MNLHKKFGQYRCSILAVGLLLCGGGVLSAADWAQWRGPNHDNVSPETGLLKSWPAEGPKLAWKAEGLGLGYSTVCIANGRVYASGDKGDACQLSAYSLADGKPLWSVRLGSVGAPNDQRWVGPRAMPVADGDLVFAVSQWGELACFQAADGKQLWSTGLRRDLKGVMPNYGYCEAPLVDGEKVLMTPGGQEGSVVALNKKTGALIWRSSEFTDAPHYSSILPIEFGGVRQYIQLTGQSLAGIAAEDGKLLWRTVRDSGRPTIPTPVYADGNVYVSSGYSVGCSLYKLASEGGKFSASRVYGNSGMVNQHGGVVKSGDCVYGFSDGKGWTCQDFRTGKTQWVNQGIGKGSLTCADGMLYLRAEDGAGTVALIDASSSEYKEHGRFNPPGRTQKNSWAHPVVASGKLFLRDQDGLLCYDIQSK